MSWNYRVCRKGRGKETEFGIYEVYYDDSGSPNAWAEGAVCVVADDLGDLRAEVQHIQEAFNKPVLNLDVLDKKLAAKRQANTLATKAQDTPATEETK